MSAPKPGEVRFHHFEFARSNSQYRLAPERGGRLLRLHRVRLCSRMTLAVRTREDGWCEVGMAVCSADDQFSRRRGRCLAGEDIQRRLPNRAPPANVKALIEFLREFEGTFRWTSLPFEDAPRADWFEAVYFQILSGARPAGLPLEAPILPLNQP